MSISTFNEIYLEYTFLYDSYNFPITRKKAEEEYERRIRSAYIMLQGNKNFSIDEAIDYLDKNNKLESIKMKCRSSYNDKYKEYKERKEELEKELQNIAAKIELVKQESYNIYYSTSKYSYLTQGYGATTYAQGMAKIRELDAMYYNIPSKVEYEDKTEEYNVLVALDTIQVEILRWKPTITFKEMLRCCLKNALNPRVYWPMLPWGTEEKLMLDMRGNDIKGK